MRELRDNAITNGYLHKPDYMNQYALKSRPVIIIGYTKMIMIWLVLSNH